MISTAAWKTEQRNVLSFPPFQQARRRLTKKSSLLSIVVSHRWGSLHLVNGYRLIVTWRGPSSSRGGKCRAFSFSPVESFSSCRVSRRLPQDRQPATSFLREPEGCDHAPRTAEWIHPAPLQTSPGREPKQARHHYLPEVLRGELRVQV